jgi:hypothetical protein
MSLPADRSHHLEVDNGSSKELVQVERGLVMKLEPLTATVSAEGGACNGPFACMDDRLN